MARGLRGAHLLALFWTFFGSLFGQETINGFSLSPPYFNLAQGSIISATATCGQDESGAPTHDLYCKLVGGPTSAHPHNFQGQNCDYCASGVPDKAHPVTNAIDGTERWWQSPPLSRGLVYNEVNVTLDLGQLFHVAYVLIKFANSPRPDLWVLERSVDHGRTYTPWQYFAHSKHECIERFGKEPNARVVGDDDQLCTTDYSRIVPLENGEIVVSLVNGRPGSRNFTYSPRLRDFTKATNIRLHFLRTNTLLGHLISKAQRDPTVTRRYYYSIKDISVGGRCVCHGHAKVCGGPRNYDNPNRLQCECQHNTCGDSCDRCCPGFNQQPWRAATVDNPNQCQPCQCFSHAFDCYYDPEVERTGASLDTYGRYNGGGVCINCQHNTAGVNCERCQEGFFRPYGVPPESHTGCIQCRCDGRMTAGCEMGSGRCICKPQYEGEDCGRCAAGYYQYPLCIAYPVYQRTTTPAGPIIACPPGYFGSTSCQLCPCDSRGTEYQVCDPSGRCLCRQGVEGQGCDRCRPGHHSFPTCQACPCDGAGVSDSICSPTGQCICFPNFQGQDCDQCASGYYGYPDCAACQCSSEGSYGSTCNPLSGQCLCLPGVVGQQCDRCASGLRFPYCSAPIIQCNPAGTETTDPQTASCRCLLNTEGKLCDRCKPLYWNLAPENPRGCTECRCELRGTLSGVGECDQKTGQCHCKPNICSQSCDSCSDGYYLLENKNYFGCQGCQCDIGGAFSTSCEAVSGQCWCRKNTVGPKCTQPAPGFYFPTLHQFKYEVEDGTTPNSRPVRFGYDPQEFPDYSWRGYAMLSPAQSEVRVSVHVDLKEATDGLFRVVLRFTNPTGTSVTGNVKVANNRGGAEQSTEVVFPKSPSPSFLTVPGEGFTEPFVLTPGKWVIHIRAQGILLDYLVLLPQDYYEAPLLQEKITEPCTYVRNADQNTNCLLYKHVAMEGFSSALASQGRVTGQRGRRRRQAPVRRLTPEHPEMAAIDGRQSQLQLSLRVQHPGPHALVLEYASEVDSIQNVNILINDQSGRQIEARANIYSCAYSFLCRSVAVDPSSQVAVVQLTHKTELLLMTRTTSFFLYKVYAVPAEEFSLEYVKPKPLCVSIHGRFTEDSQHCILSQFNKPSAANILCAARDGLISSAPAVAPQIGENESWRQKRQSGLFSGFEPMRDEILLKYPQTEITFTAKVPVPGRYVVVIHYRQPEHISFPVEVQVDAGLNWKGSINASFCPSVSGCRDVVVADGRIALDFDQQTWQPPRITVTVPPRKTLILDYIMVVPESSYTPDLLRAKPLNKSAAFTQQCREDGFYTDRSSSQFCRDAARSLAAAYNDGALPCDCDKSGSTGSSCDPLGGQCLCRQHVIGRQCTKCATGYFGFPNCRPCNCGTRLCDEVTGRCICPPQTIKPACDVCQNETFSYHPLLGCEGCDCSKQGVKAGPDCDPVTGQCSCKPRISGRQCDRCAPGFYRFPDCVPCNCNLSGVGPDICHPDTGRCHCKKNVAGKWCGVCREGSFFFDPSNSQGCTSCFCFGATDRCQSSRKRRGKFVDMRGWRLESADQQEVPSVLNTVSNTVVADIQELPPTIQALHWVAPSSYLGDRVSSYGGFLTYQSKSFGIPSEGMTLIDRSADVLLTGRGMSLIHVSPQVQNPDRVHQGRVPLLEGHWRHAGTNRPVTRDELLKVLAGLEGLRVRGLYYTQTQRLSLGEVGLEEATDSGTGGPASNVETCSCPPENNGESCQKCAPGYFRNGSGTYLGRCVPCNCNGLADECEETTGKCLNCRYNSAGDRCERCKEGYYGSAAQRTCKVCPCPFTDPQNSFAVGCKEVYGDIQCVCRAGYTGDRCERCAPGYYGDPLIPGGKCSPCNCIGNGNLCDPRTGVCKNTLEPGDTNTDEHCQECDNCAQTLLHDLEKLDSELKRIKSLLENASVSTLSKERLKELEKAVAETESLIKKYGTSMNNEKNRVSQLEDDMSNLADDISSLKSKADRTADDADKAVADLDKTHKKAKDLEAEVQAMLKKIKALLNEIMDGSSGGSRPPSEDLAKMLKDAKRMVEEMEDRNFAPQKDAADKEREEAKKLLDYIKTNVSKTVDENEAEAQRLRGRLKDYEGKLKELDKALKDSADLLKKAKTQNGLNSQAVKDLQKRIDDLKKEKKTVESQMVMATNELRKMEDSLKKLKDSKKEYEKLAAQLDGAKTDATKKVNELTKAADEDVVEAAEEHARRLKALADELEKAMRDANSRPEVRNAKDAIDAYKNIIDAIRAAEEAANQAKDAAEKALNDFQQQDLPGRADNLRNSADNLVTEAVDAKDDLKVAADKINKAKQRLKDAEKKKRDLEKKLSDVQNQLNSINRDDISNLIDEVKRAAAGANNSATNTLDRLEDIKKELDKINLPAGGGDLSNVLADVDKSVKNLLNNIPTLTDKIKEVEELTRSSNLGNITDNIKKIKELIEHARDAADKVAIPMNFEGNGHVELRAPKSLEDLKAFTDLALSLQRPPGRGDGKRRRRQAGENPNQFVMYLGNKDSSKNYIGMVLRNHVLFGIYKLNGVEKEMKTSSITRSPSELSTFDDVRLRRIYQDASLSLSKKTKTRTPPITDSILGEESKNLLDLTHDDVVFYVGGYPDDFTPPNSFKLPKYTGCIELSSFNDRAVSIYNFKSAVNVNKVSPCSRNIPRVDTSFYEGTGYGKVDIKNGNSRSFIINISVRSRSENALLLFIGDAENYLAVLVQQGVVYLHSNLFPEPKTNNLKVFPDDKTKHFSLMIINKGLIVFRIGDATVEEIPIAIDHEKFKEYYIGGAPTEIRERYNITTPPFKGCLTASKLNNKAVPIDESVGVSKGCLEESLVSRKAELNRGGSLSKELSGFSLANDVTVSLGFKSTENEGLILQNKQQANGIQLGLENGHVVLALNTKKWKSKQPYNDGLWHYLTVTKRGARVELMIDDQDSGQEQAGSIDIPTTANSLYLGKKLFQGCVANLYTRRPQSLYKPEDLSDFESTGRVLMDMCTADSRAQQMLDRKPKKDSMKPAMNESVSLCAQPAVVKRAYHLGGPISSLGYGLPLQVLLPRPHFSLDVKTRSAEGLLFFAGTRGGVAHLALYMSKGRIRLSVGKHQEIFNREKYNDGKWHSVMFSLEKKKFRLVVDGIRALDGQLTAAQLAAMKQFTSPVYVGNAPESFHKQLKSKDLPKHSMSGCVKNFKMNGAPITPTSNRGAGPCFEGQTLRGAFFTGNGGHVVINESFVVGSSFEMLMNIRPRTLTGLLLHVGDSGRAQSRPAAGHYLSVYMLRGEIVAQVNNGRGEFRVSVQPKKPLCDGMFHKISVIKRKNVVQLYVDTLDNYKIGPPSSTTTLTKDPLFVGGMPDATVPNAPPVTASFVGCIQDMRINGEAVAFDRLASVFGPLNLRECPG
ncbi:laminin subunit alpha-3-like isoform 1-T1 [Synchiropus picturatus]